MAKSKFNYDVKNLLVSENTITILGVIGDDWWEESNTSNTFLREFKNLEKKFDHIVVEINSPGGSLFHGQPIYNAIKNSQVKTTTRVIGMAASMAGIIALAGDEVECFDNAMLMLHSPINIVYGNAKEFRDMADTLDKFADTLITSVSKKIGKTTDETRSLYFDYNDHFLTAAEAKEAGLIDSIIDEAADLPEDIQNMEMTDIIAYYSNKYSHKPKSSPFKNFISNLIDTPMKIDSKILAALNLDAGSTLDQIVEAIQNIVTSAQTAQDSLTAETTARETAETNAADIQAQLDTANENITNVTTERDNLKGQITKASDVLDTIHDSIKTAKTFEAKVTALTSFTDEEETKQFLNRDKNNADPVPGYVKAAEDFLSED